MKRALILPRIMLVLLPHFTFSQPTAPADVKHVLDRVLNYVNQVTPAEIVNSKTGERITELKTPVAEATMAKGQFRIATHEWGLAYSGMLMAADATGDRKFADYVEHRFKFIGEAAPYFRAWRKAFPNERSPFDEILDPHSLDDSGSICAAMIKGSKKGFSNELKPVVDDLIRFIMTKAYRLSDGTFARNRPYPNSIWTDDLYQGIPALAYYGASTGDVKYFDEATKQVDLYSKRLLNKSKGIYPHGMVEGMDPQPQFYWARVNGWALMAITELLEVLPANHPSRPRMMELYKTHVNGLVPLQSGEGLWHQLLDRNDSYLETSASAMFVYSIAHGINKKWLSAEAYGPMVLLGWMAVSKKVNDMGQVEGTSAGTSMAFDAAFYYNRPVSALGPHGYGAVLLAGASMFRLLTEHSFETNGPVVIKK